MRMNRKVMALILSSAMLVSGVGTGVGTSFVQAASGRVQLEKSSKTATEDVTTATDAVTTATGSVTVSPSADPVEPSVNPMEPSAAPSESPVESSVPSAIPTTPAAATSTPSAVPTGPAATASSPAVTYKVGDEFTKGNYIYKVLSTASGTEKATVKVKTLSAAGQKKTSLTVQESIVKDNTEFLVTGIHKKAFKSNTSLKKVTIGKNVTYIGERAFQGLTKLTSVKIGANVTSIKKWAFAGCTSLRKVTIPSNVTLIGVKVFNNCSKLKAVVINSKKLTVVKTSAFRNTKSGCYVVIPSGKKALYKSLIQSSGAKKMKIYTY